MHIVAIENLTPGDILGKSLYNDHFNLLLAKGVALDSKLIARLKKLGYSFIYVDSDATKGVEPSDVISDSLRLSSQTTIKRTYDSIRSKPALKRIEPGAVKWNLRNENSLKHLINIDVINKLSDNLLEELVDDNVKVFDTLSLKSDGSLEYQHAIDVALMSLLLGQEFGCNMEELRVIARAALMHDVGKTVVIDPSLMEDHPTYSMLIFQKSEPRSYVEQVTVEQHHERIDGKGYPNGLKDTDDPPVATKSKAGSEIFRYAQILSVANSYDNLISGLEDGTRYTPEEALKILMEGRGARWNSHVVRAMHRVVQLYPVGSTIRILKTSSGDFIGYEGVISRASSESVKNPEIILIKDRLGSRISPLKIDFANETSMNLELIL